jgi:hypothetical protein
VQFLTREKKFFKDFVGHLKKPHEAAIKEAQIQVVVAVPVLCAYLQAIFYGVAIALYFWMYAASFRLGAYFVGKGEMTPIDVFR